MACGTSYLKDAFNIAKEETKQKYGIDEAEKFGLLPEDGDHCVSIFSQMEGTSTSSDESSVILLKRSDTPPVLHPSPPQPFVGCQSELSEIIEALTEPHCRFVCVTGERGMGKASLVKTCCQYMYERIRLGGIDWSEIAWFNYSQEARMQLPWILMKSTRCLISSMTDPRLLLNNLTLSFNKIFVHFYGTERHC